MLSSLDYSLPFPAEPFRNPPGIINYSPPHPKLVILKVVDLIFPQQPEESKAPLPCLNALIPIETECKPGT
jgi:hypothetical protein